MASPRMLSTDRLALFQKILKERGIGMGLVPSEPLRRRAGDGPCALSFAQERLWFIDQLEPGSSLYNVPVQARLPETPRIEVLRRTLAEILRRHEVLRTRYESVAGRPVQVIGREPRGEILPLVDLGDLAGTARGREMRRLAVEEAERPFDLSRGPVFRALLVRLDAEEHRLLANLHHIVCDAASTEVLLRELSALYAAFSAGEASPLPDLPVQYADYAAWQRAWFASEGSAAELAYWRGVLGADPPVLELPTDRPRPAVQTYRGSTYSVVLSGELSASLGRLSRQSGTTLFMTLLAVFMGLLRRYSGQSDLCVGTPISGRHRVELEGLIGFFLNTLVIRVGSPGDPRFADLLALVRERSLAAFAHQDLPFEKLVEELQPSRSLSYSPLFQALFVLLHTAAPPSFTGGVWRGETVEVRTSKFDLTLSVDAGASRMAVEVEYNTDLFDGTTVARLLAHFGNLAAGAARQPEERLSSLSMLGEAEWQALLVESNDTSSSYAVGGVHRLFEAQVERIPEATALVWEGESLSYGELDRRARRLAHRLKELGVGLESRVGLQLERSADLLIGLLAILKAGGAYVPIDPMYPPQRRELMLADAQVSVLLTRESLAGELSGRYSLLCLDREPLGSALDVPWGPVVEVAESNLAYVIYTSGSTGRPKGVSLPHGALRNLIEWHLETLLGGARTLQFASVSFDASFHEMFACWGSGGTLYLISEEVRRDVAILGQYLVSRGLEKVILPVVVLQQLAEEYGRGGDLPPLQEVTTTGEQLQTTRAMGELFERLGSCAFHNHYGPSESHVVTAYRLSREPGEWLTHPSIGVPIANSSTYLLDSDLAPVPVGVAGELYLGGVCLARGYLGRPDLTADRFVPHPFGEAGDERLYRTGDKVRRLVDGTLDFLGRFDHQVKVRGFRVELEEIESVLGRHPEVLQTVVLAREMGVGDRRLVAYLVTAGGGGSAREWRQYLKDRLPEYMVPSWFVVLDSLPLTPNGKVDRRALPEPERVGVDAGAGYVAPRTPAEEVVAAIWSEVLGVARVGAEDNFFELGGHSLLAVRVIARLREVLRVELPLRELFEAPTVALLTARVGERRRGDSELVAPALAPVARDRPLPLSFAQERLWFLDQLQPGGAQYNLPLALRLSGRLEPAALAWTLGQVERRHEALRTIFPAAEGAPVQVIRPAREPFPLPVVDLSGLAEGVREVQLARLAAEEAMRPFDLAQGPLWRGSLLRLGEEDHGVLLTQHHIISDGWSLSVLVREVVELYGSALEGRPPRLADLPIQYADYASWQRSWLQGETLAAGLSYWRQRLAGAPPVLELPGDRPRPAVRDWRGAVQSVRLGEGLSQELRLASVRQGATPFTILLAGWMAALARWSGQEDLSVGTPVAGRPQIELEGLIGFFINTLVSRTDLSRIESFRDLVGQVREAWLSAYEHQSVPFEKLVEELAPQRSLSYTPLFQVMFVLQNTPRESARVGGLGLSPVGVAGTSAKFDLTLSLEEQAGVFAGGLEYSPDLFDAPTIQRFAGQLAHLLGGAMAAPEQNLRSLPLLSAAEEQQLVVEWSGMESEAVGDLFLPELFLAQAARRPEAVAVRFAGQTVSYCDLAERAGRLASQLRGLGIGPESLVAICLERSVEMLVAILGTLQAGGAYLPLDPGSPAERLAFMASDAGAAVVLTQERLRARLPELAGRVLFLDSEPSEEAFGEISGPRPWTTPESLAYVIYTSGSTGLPKGVMVSHGGLLNYLRWAVEAYGMEEGPGSLVHSPLSFDLTVTGLLGPLLVGGTVELMAEGAGPGELLEALRAQDYGLVKITPAHLEVLGQDLVETAGPPRARVVVVGGDALLAERLESWREQAPEARIVNEYGPTETVVGCAIHEVPAGAPGRGRVPIGRAISNLRLFVLDPHFQPVPAGVTGELYIGGRGVARGYLGRPDLTAARFVPDGFGGGAGGRLYRSGDLVRHLPDGALEFLGRLDHQVKVRGFRVELGEIESVLGRHPEVLQVAVLAREVGPGDRRLVAYVVPARGEGDAAEWRRYLRERLPEYMVPSWFVALDALPLTPNGKLDRGALPEPERASTSGDAAGYVAPRTPAEEVVAAIWSEVLDVPQVGVEDNFFELGGHSLLAVRVIARLRDAFGVELPLRQLFEAPTVALLTSRAEDRKRSGSFPAAPPLTPVPRGGELPLSFAQERLWFIDQLEPGSSLYNVPVQARLLERPRVEVLRRTLAEILHRHEVLRTRYESVAGRPVQVIDREPIGEILPLVDLGGLVGAARGREVRRLAVEDAERPFDLGRGPVFRALLVRLDERLDEAEHRLLANLHHIVCDAASTQVLLRELSALSAAFFAGEASPLPELPVQYADYAAWQRGWFASEGSAAELAYWRGVLGSDPPVLELPTDRPRPAVQTYRGATRTVVLSGELSASLGRLSRQSGTTLFMTLLAVFVGLLRRYSGQSDLSVGTPISGRHRVELEGLIGFFLNTLVIRVDSPGDPRFADLLALVREKSLAAFAHQDLPFEKLVEELQPSRNLSHSPLFQVLFVLLHSSAAPSLPGGRWHGEPVEVRTSKFDLTLSIEAGESGMAVAVEYNTDLFDGTTMARLLGHFGRLAAGVALHPEQRLSVLPMLGEAELQALLVEGNDTSSSYAVGGVHRLFEAQVERMPEATALVWEGESLSYGELDRRARRLARRLMELGVGVESRVGLQLERSVDLLIGLLAILKAGGAYVPIDPLYPPQRRELMLADARVSVLLTRESLASELPGRYSLLCLEREPLGSELDLPWSPAEVAEANLAYVIYTSGSTGRPKGVSLPHGALRNLIEWHLETLLGGARTLQFASVSFDASFHEMFACWGSGGTLYLISEEVRQDVASLGRYLVTRGLEKVILPVVVLQQLAEEYGRGGDLPPLQEVTTTGEQLQTTRAMGELFERLGSCAFHNHYGPSESHVVTAYRLSREPGEWLTHPSIGVPIANSTTYLLDRDLAPVPAGVAGELYLGGVCLARGYLGRPDLTADRFVPHPFSESGGERLYRTGDKVRRLVDGTLDFLGRFDHQVKVRGFRVELEEIESVLGRHPEVLQTVVIARDLGIGDRRLVAYLVTAGGGGSTREWRQYLKERLPEYMVPSWFVVLESLPLTPNGKVDRRALPEPERAGADSGAGYVAPRTPAEEVVAAIWSEVLSVPRVGAEHNFFELGGHSLLAVRVIARLRDALGVELPLRELFEAPTVALLTAQVEERRRGDSELVAPALAPVARDRPLPLSFAQERLWFLDQLQPGSAQYNLPLALRLSGPLEPAALAWTLGQVERRHEALRTVFPAVEGAPVQVIRPAREPFPLPVVDLSGLAEGAREEQLARLAAEEAMRPFDLAQGPLWRGSLLRLGEEDHGVLLTQHHIVSDGWSLSVLVREVVELYGSVLEGRPPRLAELPIQYADYASWQRSWLQGETLTAGLSYWRQRLAGAPPVLELPGDRPRPAVRGSRGAARSVRLRESLSQRLRLASVRQGATPFMILLAGWMAALARWSGQEDLSVGTPVAGRPQIELEGLIGFFINTLVSRTNLSGIESFRDLVGQVREAWLSAYEHQAVPFEKLVEELAPQRSLSYTPLFQVMFVLQNAPRESARAGGLGLSPVGVAGGSAKFDLTLSLEEQAGVFVGGLEYSAELFDAPTIARFVGHLTRLLDGAVAAPEQDLRSLPLLSAAEEQQLVVEWSGTPGAEAEPLTLPELFLAQAARRPEAPALVCGEQRWTYGELAFRAARLAGRLAALGVGPEERVAVRLPRSAGLVAALLGVLEAGSAYVPVDPAYPAERQSLMLEDSRARVVVTSPALLPSLPAGAWTVLTLDPETGEPCGLAAAGAAAALHRALPGNLAYLIYTSGSTGRPKAVALEHRSAVGRVRWAREAFSAAELAGVLFATSVCFDLSVFELFVPLSWGGRVIVAENALALPSLPAAAEVTLVNTVPSAMAELVREGLLPAGVRTVNLAGEPLPLQLAEAVHATGTVERLWNLYGPSEDTTYSTAARLEPGEERPPAIGRPLPGSRARVLDRQGRPVPLGVAGELFLGGSGLARGYFGRPELTAERFVPDPAGEPGSRLYRTGDLVRHRPDGALEFLGRLDHQVKVRGFRVELGEIESVLGRHPEVLQAAVLAREVGPGDRRLVAYVVPARGEGDAAEWRRYLRERLPEHMVPSRFVALESLPLTPNGKLDRDALPALPSANDWSTTPPRDELELALLEIWEDLFAQRTIGVKDDFFTLGGHSLLAVRLMARIERELGTRLPLATLFQAPTIESLALLLKRQQPPSASSSLVLLREGSKRPFFCVHPAHGHVLCYFELSRRLPDRPFYGFQVPASGSAISARDRSGATPFRIEELAQSYLQELRNIQPEGPYLLGGWSMGGAVAYEMARQLEFEGASVALLALIDSFPPTGSRAADELDESPLLAPFAQELGVPIEPLRELAADLRSLPLEQKLAAFREAAVESGALPPDMSFPLLLSLFQVYTANVRAMRRYSPSAYGGRITLLRATGSAVPGPDPAEAWGSLAAGGVDLDWISGDHYSILHEPNVAALAERLDERLAQAERITELVPADLKR